MDKPVKTAAEPATPCPKRPDRKILLVEDDQVLQFLTLKQLSKLGLEADAVRNGREAVEAVAGGNYLVVLMDCHLPGLDGYEAARTIRRSETTGEKHVTIIAMTASAMEEDRDECLAAGMDDFMSKPVTLKQLKAMLTRWLP